MTPADAEAAGRVEILRFGAQQLIVMDPDDPVDLRIEPVQGRELEVAVRDHDVDEASTAAPGAPASEGGPRVLAEHRGAGAVTIRATGGTGTPASADITPESGAPGGEGPGGSGPGGGAPVPAPAPGVAAPPSPAPGSDGPPGAAPGGSVGPSAVRPPIASRPPTPARDRTGPRLRVLVRRLAGGRVRVRIVATDPSGVRRTTYRVGRGRAVRYRRPFVIPVRRLRTLVVTSTDRRGNATGRSCRTSRC